MRFVELEIPGAFLIETEPRRDERGSFGRVFCRAEFARRGLDPRVEQCSVSRNRRAGTIRGLHLQAAPWREAKLVRCTRGAAFDVIADLRPESPAFRRWAAVEITADDDRAVYVPEGVAHGFQTLVDDTELAYQISVPHHPESARGVRWDDPALAIAWPRPVTVISARDAAYPDLDPAPAGTRR